MARRFVPVRLAAAPGVWVVDDFVTADEIAHARAIAADEAGLARAEIPTYRGRTGFSFEMPVPGDPVLERIERRLQRLTGLSNRLGGTLRYRHYRPGELHPPHVDAYSYEGLHLVLTAMICLEAPRAGGETTFARAAPAPVVIVPRVGRLAVWGSYTAAGTPDPDSVHEGRPVLEGDKVTLTAFVYRPAPVSIVRIGRSAGAPGS
jgi:prolyl 4-hydroxylase